MSKKKEVSEQITKINPNLPSFMQNEEVTGTEALQEYVRPPRIKVVQKQAADELLQVFSPGDVILQPTMDLVLQIERDNKGRPVEDSDAYFSFVPLFFYAEWATLNPIQLKNEAPMIRYRTVDPNDPIVAKSRNSSLRYEPIPERPDLKVRHVEFLNFIITLVNHPLENNAILLSFSRGEHGAGSTFASLIKMRKAPLYGCKFNAQVRLRPGSLGEWFGIDVSNPDSQPWVDESQFEAFKKLHLEYAEYHRSARLRADLDTSLESDDAATTPTEEF